MTDEGATDESEPDATYYSRAISRRELLAAGATAAASGVAGCGECYGPKECGAAVSKELDSALQGETDDGLSREEAYERTRTQLEVVEGYELELGEATLDSLQFTLKNGLLPNQQPEEAVEGTLRVYGNVPVGGSDVVGETGASLRGSTQDHEVSLEFDEDLMNTPRELEVRFASPQLDASEIVIGRSDVVYLPFDNVARDEQTLRAVGPKFVSDEDWASPRYDSQKVDVWYDESDDPPFDIPSLDRSEYDIQTYEDEEKEYYDGSDWFDLHNIELTAIIRVPVLSHEFASDDAGEVQGPYYDWTVVTLRLSALEYLESMLFNSPATQKLLNPAGEYSVGDGAPYTSKEVTDKENFGCSVMIHPEEYISADPDDHRISSSPSHVAQEAAPASDYFFYGALHELYWDEEFEPEELRKVNPIKFCVGRGMSRRWGETFSEALEAKPYADRFESLQYQKLTTLKAFVGNIDYDFQADVYQNTPEETVVNMYLSATTDEYAGADCVTASMFFTGVAYWMTGCHPVMVLVKRAELPGHFWPGLKDIELPELSHLGTLPVAGYRNLETEPHEARQFEYTYTDVECTEGYPSIGFDRPSLNDFRRHVAWSNLEPLSLTTHLPLNDEWEPDVDGEVRAPDEGSFRELKANPFEMNVVYHFDEE